MRDLSTSSFYRLGIEFENFGFTASHLVRHTQYHIASKMTRSGLLALGNKQKPKQKKGIVLQLINSGRKYV
jgi:hypothetical protein